MSGQALPPAPDFSLLCHSLASQALWWLGAAPHPETGEKTLDLLRAKSMIDLLAMLKEKTEGNRTEEEEKVLTGLLFDLRMRYVEKSKASRSR